MRTRSVLRVFDVLSSRGFLLVLLVVWTVFYVSVAIWSEEAFARFVGALGESPLVQAPFVLFLLSGLLNLIRETRVRWLESVGLSAIWVILPAGVLVFLTGFFLSASLRQHEWLVRGEGQTVQPAWEKQALVLADIDPALKGEMLDTESGSGIFRYEPTAHLDTPLGLRRVKVFPPTRVGDTYYHILQFGLAPGVRILRDGEMMDEGYFIVRILPPGAEDVFAFPGSPYRFSLRMAPERILTKGRARAKLFRVTDPSYAVTVTRGNSVVFEGDSRDGVSFEGYELEFLRPSYWVWLDAARDSGYLVMVGGVVLIVVGFPLMLIFIVYRLLTIRTMQVSARS